MLTFASSEFRTKIGAVWAAAPWHAAHHRAATRARERNWGITREEFLGNPQV
jgi:hypothetical protein